MGRETWKNIQWMQEVMYYVSAPIIVYFVCRNLFARLDPDSSFKAELEESNKKAVSASQHLTRIFSRRPEQRDGDDGDDDDDEAGYGSSRSRSKRWREEMPLTSYEQTIAMEVVSPDEIPVSFEDIGGMDDIIDELKEAVIHPLTLPHLFARSSRLLAPPSGVLLYGPPGCGKTMLAKALAHESGACFINLHISTLTEKWYGDSNKLVNAVFSLARKLQPTIVFMDEIDAVMGRRSSADHEASGMVKAEFMTHWDGLASATKDGTPQRICILGATNRVQDIDDAILRRMPKKFPVPLPAAGQRRRILSLILRDTTLDPADFDLEHVVRLTAGMSGSDLKDVCRDAAMIPVRDLIRSKKLRGEPITARIAADVRPIRTADFFAKAGLSAVSEARMKASGSKPAVAAHPTGEVDSDEYVTDDDDDRPAASAIAENHR